MVDENKVLRSLVAHGAPLAGWTPRRDPLPLEETLVRALGCAKTNATVLRVLPLVLAKHSMTVQFEELKHQADALGFMQELGMLVSLTVDLHPRLAKTRLGKLGREMDARLDEMKRLQPSAAKLFFTTATNSYTLKLAEARTPAAARKWGFLMNMPESGFKAAF